MSDINFYQLYKFYFNVIIKIEEKSMYYYYSYKIMQIVASLNYLIILSSSLKQFPGTQLPFCC